MSTNDSKSHPQMNAAMFPPASNMCTPSATYPICLDPWGRPTYPPPPDIQSQLSYLASQIQFLETENIALREERDSLIEEIDAMPKKRERPVDRASKDAVVYDKLHGLYTAFQSWDRDTLEGFARKVVRSSNTAFELAVKGAPGSRKSESGEKRVPDAPDPRSEAVRRKRRRTEEPDRREEDEEKAESARKLATMEAEQAALRRAKRREEEAASYEMESRKRKMKESGLCVYCGKEYVLGENKRGACGVHSGGKEILWDDSDGQGIWGDYDETRQGPCEDHIDDPKFAEGFIWSCCKEYSDVRRCSASRHCTGEETRSKRSRVRIAS